MGEAVSVLLVLLGDVPVIEHSSARGGLGQGLDLGLAMDRLILGLDQVGSFCCGDDGRRAH